MIYFTRSGDCIKIGYAKVPDRRIATLATGNPNALVVLGVMEGGLAKERLIHERFAHLRVRGEWFALSHEILRYIEGHCRPMLLGVRRVGIGPPPNRWGLGKLLEDRTGAAVVLGIVTPLGLFISVPQLIDRKMTWLPLDVHVWSTVVALAVIAAVVAGAPIAAGGLLVTNRIREWRYRRSLRRIPA